MPGKEYGLVSEKDASTKPFQEVAVNLIEPWSVEYEDEKLTVQALIIIKPVTNLQELVGGSDKIAK